MALCLFMFLCMFFKKFLGVFSFGLVVISFLLIGIISIFFHSFVSHCLRLSIQSGTSSPDFFIKFAIVRTNCLSSSVKRVMAFPVRPPLPVLPILWMYETKDYGKSKFTTWLTVLKSIPLDMRSVQIRTQIFPTLNYLMISSLSSFFLSACMTSTLTPSYFSSLNNYFALSLDWTNMSIGGSNPSEISCLSVCNLPSSLPTYTSFCTTVEAVAFLMPIWTLIGSFVITYLTTYSIPGCMVAENMNLAIL